MKKKKKVPFDPVAYKQKWDKKNTAHRLDYQKTYREDHGDECTAYAKKYATDNRDKLTDQQRKRREDPAVRAKINQRQKDYRKRVKEALANQKHTVQ